VTSSKTKFLFIDICLSVGIKNLTNYMLQPEPSGTQRPISLGFPGLKKNADRIIILIGEDFFDRGKR